MESMLIWFGMPILALLSPRFASMVRSTLMKLSISLEEKPGTSVFINTTRLSFLFRFHISFVFVDRTHRLRRLFRRWQRLRKRRAENWHDSLLNRVGSQAVQMRFPRQSVTCSALNPLGTGTTRSNSLDLSSSSPVIFNLLFASSSMEISLPISRPRPI